MTVPAPYARTKALPLYPPDGQKDTLPMKKNTFTPAQRAVLADAAAALLLVSRGLPVDLAERHTGGSSTSHGANVYDLACAVIERAGMPKKRVVRRK